MRNSILLFAVFICLLTAGCSSYPSNLMAQKNVLSPGESATFDQEDNHFSVWVNTVEPKRSDSHITSVIVTFTVVNEGQNSFGLVAYPKLSGASGTIYSGKSVFLGTLMPGVVNNGKAEIFVPSAEASQLLEKEALFSLKFQTMRPLPYEAVWKIDLSEK